AESIDSNYRPPKLKKTDYTKKFIKKFRDPGHADGLRAIGRKGISTISPENGAKLDETFTRTLDVLSAAKKRLQRDPAAADRIAKEIGYQTTPEGRSLLKDNLTSVISG